MIFVTVGSTYFEELIEAVDRLAGDGRLGPDVVCQIGSGQYEPRHCRYFRWTDNFDHYLASSALIITHGGMTVLEALWRNKPLIAVVNTGVLDNDQAPFLERLSQIFDITWTRDPREIGNLLDHAKHKPFKVTEPHIARYIETLV